MHSGAEGLIPRRRNDLSTDLSTPVDNSGRDLMLWLIENDGRESLLPKEEIKNCIAGFLDWLTSGSDKISLTLKLREQIY